MAIYSLNHSSIGRSTHAAGTAGAHVGYITRSGACLSVMAERMPLAEAGQRGGDARSWLDAQEAADRKNARVIDKVMLALPRELTAEEQAALVRSFAEEVTQGRAPWLAAIHQDHPENPHCHLVIRDKDPETGKRVVGLSEKGSTERLREAWEVAANLALEKAGREERIDRRSLKDQGIEREATIHVGPQAAAMERQGKQIDSQTRQVTTPKGNVRDVRWAEIDGGRTRASHNDRVSARNAARNRARGPQGIGAAKLLHPTREALRVLSEGRPAPSLYATMPVDGLRTAWDGEFRLVLKSVQDRAAKVVERVQALRKELADRLAGGLLAQRLIARRRDDRLEKLHRTLTNPMSLRLIAGRILTKANPRLVKALMVAERPAPDTRAKVEADHAEMQAQAKAVQDRERAQAMAAAIKAARPSIAPEPPRQPAKPALTPIQERAATQAASEQVERLQTAAMMRKIGAFGYGDGGVHWRQLSPDMQGMVERVNAMSSDDQAKTFGKIQAGLVGRYRDDPRLIERDRESLTRRGPELSR